MPNQNKSSFNKEIVVGLIVLLVLCFSTCCGFILVVASQESKSKPSITKSSVNKTDLVESNKTKPSTPIPTSTPIEKQPEYFLNEKIKVKDVLITVYSLEEYKTSNNAYAPQKGNKYLVIDVEIENVGAEAINACTFNFRLEDKDSFNYMNAVADKNNELPCGELDKGKKTRGYIVYEVKDNASIQYVTYTYPKFNPIITVSIKPTLKP